MLILFPVLIVSAWVAAMLMVMVILPVALPAFSAAAIAGIGIFGVAAVIVPPVIGTISGLLGMAFGKGRVVRAFGASRVPDDHPLAQVTHRMAARLGMPGPEVYVYPDDDVNAWATGSSASTAAIGLTRGALQRLTWEQLQAVIGHELGHIAAGDNRRMHFAISFQNALVWFFGFPSWRWNAQHIFGFVGQAGIMSMSRRREYWADALGAILTSPEAMADALRAVAHDKKKPAKKRRYYNQLMFNWHGGSLLASHPTFDQRLAALQDGHHYAAAVRKMGGASSRRPKPIHTRAPAAATSRPQPLRSLAAWFGEPWVEGTAMVVLPLLLLGIVWYAVQTAHAPSPAVVVQVPAPIAVPVIASRPESAPPIVRAEKLLPPAAGPRVAAWSRAEEPVVVTPPVDDDLAYEPPGYRCFKLLERRLPSGVTHAFDEQKDRSVYAATTASSASALRELPNALRSCLKQSGGKLQSQSSSVENRKIEIWAFAGEITCWFTPQADKRGSEAPNMIGRCHSPED